MWRYSQCRSSLHPARRSRCTPRNGRRRQQAPALLRLPAGRALTRNRSADWKAPPHAKRNPTAALKAGDSADSAVSAGITSAFAAASAYCRDPYLRHLSRKKDGCCPCCRRRAGGPLLFLYYNRKASVRPVLFPVDGDFSSPKGVRNEKV